MARNEAVFQQKLAELKTHAQNDAPQNIRSAFALDKSRFATFSRSFNDLLFDFSKCAVNARSLQLLTELAQAAGVEERRDAMFAGEPINSTENRAVLHVALRAPETAPFAINGRKIMPEIYAVLAKMAKFADALRSGQSSSETGQKFTDIVNIGIGGSDLGPAMATAALAPYHNGPKTHFVSNIDGAHIADTLDRLNPETCFFIIASKTFTTKETMTNALFARQWLAAKLGEKAVAKHFAALSTATDKVADFGINSAYVFGFWNWVGGRYSVWSSIGLSVMLAIGPQRFREFLAGACKMDEHFRHTEIKDNIPMLLGLLGFWHRIICGWPSRAVLPYEQRLARLPAYLQQLDMESNGKHITLEGEEVTMPTGPVVWGEPGTNGQHAFFQLLHQGTDIVPIEFIAFVNGHEPHLRRQRDILLSNCLAQSEALVSGRSTEEAASSLAASGMSTIQAQKLAPHKSFVGNRPSLTIMQNLLTPFALGRLLALYEHRVFVEGALMNINSFDQWGVELGKELATALLPLVEDRKKAEIGAQSHLSSTLGLVNHIHRFKN
ncbi:MAG: glucose-6-phosphate isomerase [Candidatus Tokpelaia sp.]|nr:MAG: glucose-6-phosphate isomerase [Candidatus Tokpelaia sp.]KAA6207351.1 MAG: glucose-6-phosphate isomerase [Candidatus Tokpelaia sp.]